MRSESLLTLQHLFHMFSNISVQHSDLLAYEWTEKTTSNRQQGLCAKMSTAVCSRSCETLFQQQPAFLAVARSDLARVTDRDPPPPPGPLTPLLLSDRLNLPASMFCHILSATSRNARSTPSPLFADVSTYCITELFRHHSSASSLVTCRWLGCAVSPETVDDAARSDLFPTSMITIFSSAVCRRSVSHVVTLLNVDRLDISNTSRAPAAPLKYDLVTALYVS